MKKMVFLLMALTITFSACSGEALEKLWQKGETAHTVLKEAGSTAIEAGVISEDKAKTLKEVNKKVETVGGVVKQSYKTAKDAKKDVNLD